MSKLNSSLGLLLLLYLLSSIESRAGNLPLATDPAMSVLLIQLNYWQGQNNSYKESLLLNKLANIDNLHPVYLESKIISLLKSGDTLQAKSLLLKYSQVSPSFSQTDRLTHLVEVFHRQRGVLGEARLLARRKKYSQALIKYNQLFMDYPIHRELALEYWEVLTKVNPKEERQVVNYLAALTNRFPGNIKYQIEHLKYQLTFSKDIEKLSSKFEVLLTNNVWKDEAQRLWQSLLEKTTVNQQTLKVFQSYLSYFPTDNFVRLPYEQALKKLKEQERLVKLPEYKDKLKALALLKSNGNLSEIKSHLAVAMKKFPKDTILLSASARVSLREGRHQQAILDLNQCINLVGDNIAQCRSLLKTARYWDKIAKIKKLYQLDQLTRGKRLVNSLYDYSDEGVAHLLLDAEYYLLKEQYVQALSRYNKAIVIEPGNLSAWQGLFELKSKILDGNQFIYWYESLSVTAQQFLIPNITAFKVELLRQQATQLIAVEDYINAQGKLSKALVLVPDDVWLKYDLGKAYLATSDKKKFQQLYRDTPETVEGKYAYALLLASQDYYQQASDLIRSTSVLKRSESMQLSLQRFDFEVALKQMNNETNSEKKLSLLKSMWSLHQADNEQLYSLVLGFARYGYYSDAISSLQYLLKIAPKNSIDYQVTLMSLYQKDKQFEEVERLLVQLMVSPSLTVKQQINVTQVALDQLIKYEHSRLDDYWLKDKIRSLKAYSSTQMGVLEASAKLAGYMENQEQQWQDYRALVDYFPEVQNYKQQFLSLTLALGSESIEPQYKPYVRQQIYAYITDYPFDPVGYEMAYNFLTDSDDNPDGLHYLLLAFQSTLLEQKALVLGVETRGYQTEIELQSALAPNDELSALVIAINQGQVIETLDRSVEQWSVNRLRRQVLEDSVKKNANIELAYSNSIDSGTPGASELKLEVLSLALNVPFEKRWLGQGIWYLRFEPTITNTGMLDVSQSSDYGSLRLCGIDCSAVNSVEKDTGYAIAFGLDMPRWRADIGTIPLGFTHQDIVGGIEVDGDFGDFGWTVSATKRPQTSSLLSYAGRQDPYSGLIWGAAKIFNFGGSLSYDLGEGFGAWSVIDYALITGEHIKSNRRNRLMAGAYYALMDEEWLTVDVGINLFFWQFEYDLSHYTLGQGGYYSPQSYQAISFPVSLYGRNDQWSYKFDLSLSVSQSQTDDGDYFPLHDQYQNELAKISNDYFIGDKGSGIGFYAKAAVEYKLSSHWLLGGKITLQQSDFYSPNSFMLYVRYSFGTDYFPVPKPTKFITPYKDFY